MAIYYVDTFEGSDAAAGTSWASAWRTTRPLKALFGGTPTVLDLEIRFAKTEPKETSRSLSFTSTQDSTNLYCDAVARPTAGNRKSVIPEYSGTDGRVIAWGGTLFTGSGATSPTYSAPGTYKFRMQVAAGTTNAKAARWNVSDGDFSSFAALETAGAIHYYSTPYDVVVNFTATLELCSDSAGDVVVWSSPLAFGCSTKSAKLLVLGNNDLPSGIVTAVIRVSNPSPETVCLEMGGVTAVRALSDPGYVGLRLVYVPNGRTGLPLAPVLCAGTITRFGGNDGAGFDNYRILNNLPLRTWTVYPWEPFPYQVEPLFKAGRTFGRANNPFKVYGGWNKATGEMDGITALDAANLRFFEYASSVSMDMRNLVPTFRRAPFSSTFLGYSGLMDGNVDNYRTFPYSYFKNVHVPVGGAGDIGTTIGWGVTSLGAESLMHSYYGAGVNSTVGMEGCTCGAVPLIFGPVNYQEVANCVFGTYPPASIVKGGTVSNCTFLASRSDTAAWETYQYSLDMKQCDVIASSISNNWSAEYASAPLGKMEDCTWWGAYTGPRGLRYPAKNCVFHALPGVLGPMFAGDAEIDGLVFTDQPDASIYSTSALFGHTSRSSFVVLSNANVRVYAKALTSPPNIYEPIGHRISVKNVTFHRTLACVGPALTGARLVANNLTMSGDWPALLSGAVREVAADGLIFTHAVTKLMDAYAIHGPGTTWGRITATFKNVVHPLGISDLLGTAPGSFASGASYIQTLTEEMWASTVMRVQRDTALSASGASSWRCTLTDNVGSPTRGSFLVGSLPVEAGKPFTVTARARRQGVDALVGFFIRPLGTRQYDPPEATSGETLHDIVQMILPGQPPLQWAPLSLTYTPYASGLLEVYVCVRGPQGSVVWVDSLKAAQ